MDEKDAGSPPQFPQPQILGHRDEESSGELPAPPKQEFVRYLQTRFIALLVTFMIVLAIAVEILRYESQKNQGWSAWDLDGYGGVNALKNIVPTILSMPIMTMWMRVDLAMAQLQPWVVLSKGNARASDSLLLDYTRGRFLNFKNALQKRHWVILISTLMAFANLSLSPLASIILTTISTPVVQIGVPVTTLKTLGVVPDYGTLEYFVAASGYAAAAAIHNLTDPPFLYKGSWALAEFVVPAPGGFNANQTVYVATTGIESISGCQPADSQQVVDNDAGANTTSGATLTITGSWSGCSTIITVPDTEQDQYGVHPLDACAVFPEASQYQPVIFYFYSIELRQASLTFCRPNISLWNVVAGVDMQTNLIDSVQLVDQNVAPSNVSGIPAFNGISFNTTGSDTYINARALATQAEVPFAIYQGAVNSPGGVKTVIQQPDGFLNLTNTVYTRFLALAAKSVYYVGTTPEDDTLSGEIVSLETRLYVYPLAAHMFAVAVILIAILGSVMHYLHLRDRRNTFISCDPTTVGGLLSMTSHSRFSRRLHAGMDDKEINQTLERMRFGISRRTWQVIDEAEEAPGFKGPLAVD